ncbi:hypothetical protein PIB30_048855 [Stylosanthes scabra]|uniref:Uncharacterized protein n=1 Tax=Stylosanthes scabra TaxID=79078 RepID=A0ABU6XI18_9FABA|nr:hypothetical protein [Stylosanthes scabra]
MKVFKNAQDASQERIRLRAIEEYYRNRKGWKSRPVKAYPSLASAISSYRRRCNRLFSSHSILTTSHCHLFASLLGGPCLTADPPSSLSGLSARPSVESKPPSLLGFLLFHIINYAAKSYMSAGKISGPIIFRELNGAAAGVDAWHSQKMGEKRVKASHDEEVSQNSKSLSTEGEFVATMARRLCMDH